METERGQEVEQQAGVEEIKQATLKLQDEIIEGFLERKYNLEKALEMMKPSAEALRVAEEGSAEKNNEEVLDKAA